MISSRVVAIVSLMSVLVGVPLQARDGVTYKFSGWFKPEMFYGKNTGLLNNNNKNDKSVLARHTADGTFAATVPNAKFYATFRNKGVWGNENSIGKTVKASTKDLNTVEDGHSHAIPLHIFWMREAWVSFDVAPTFDLGFTNKLTFKTGLFPFSLGRGIALGSYYAVGTEYLGYFSPDSVNQYAPGALITGDIVPSVLTYNMYTALLRNYSDGISNVGAKIRGQEAGYLNAPARGFGRINYVVAGNMFWTMFHTPEQNIVFEPYFMYNDDPEQKIEFVADAASKLGTIGMACEYAGPHFEFGFDFARNFGHQHVRGWDRNRVIKQNNDSYDVEVNSHVLTALGKSGKNIPFTKSSSDVQKQINSLELQNPPQDVCDREQYNGKVIGSSAVNVGPLTAPFELVNAEDRYRDAYNNTYKGWMFVGDAAYFLFERTLRLAAMAGVASGDEDPNNVTKDGDYKGFISLQEGYSGDRVQSMFLLGGNGKRPLAIPLSGALPDAPFPTTIDSFSNIVFTGASAEWKPTGWKKKNSFQTNVICFWDQRESKKFDIRTRSQTCEKASSFLGTELNGFWSCYLLQNMELNLVGSLFFPGGHYSDIKGLPLDMGQLKELDALDQTGFDDTQVPNIGDDIAFTFNLGLKYYF